MFSLVFFNSFIFLHTFFFLLMKQYIRKVNTSDSLNNEGESEPVYTRKWICMNDRFNVFICDQRAESCMAMITVGSTVVLLGALCR